jgi:GDP-L-fucose synthase
VGSALLKQAPSYLEMFKTTRTELDLVDKSSVAAYLSSNRIDSVIFAAAKVGGIYANSTQQKSFLLENLKLQNSIIEASLESGIRNFLFLGSSCIYPAGAPQPISESSLLTSPLEKTNEGYAIAKIAGLKLCQSIFEEQGLNFFSLMPTNLYGPNDNFDILSSHVPAALLRKFHEAKLNNSDSVTVWGTGNPYREFMHSQDLASACWYFLNQNVGGELINIGTGIELTIRDFAHLTAKITGYKGNIEFDTTKPDGVPRKVLDTSKATRMGWTSSINLEDGLALTYDWFQEKYLKGEIRGF